MVLDHMPDAGNAVAKSGGHAEDGVPGRKKTGGLGYRKTSEGPLPLLARVPQKIQERVVAPANGEALSLQLAPVVFVAPGGLEEHAAAVESQRVFSFFSGVAVNEAVRLSHLAVPFGIFDLNRILRRDEDLASSLHDVITERGNWNFNGRRLAKESTC